MLTVSVGTVIWTTIAFLVVFSLLAKFAWKPILNMIAERERTIENALNEAMKAKEEMSKLKSDNEMLLREARAQRDQMLLEAKEIKERVISDAKVKATEEADRIVAAGRAEIDNHKKAAITELKNEVGRLSVDIAEKLLRRELTDRNAQEALIQDLLKDTKMNRE